LVDAMAAYRVPCPAMQEQELRSRLAGQRQPVAIYERWREAQEALPPTEVPPELLEQEIFEEVFTPFEEEYEAAIGQEAAAALRLFENNPSCRPHRYDLRVARVLPTPLQLRWAARTAR
jgi:hypothetical protein